MLQMPLTLNSQLDPVALRFPDGVVGNALVGSVVFSQGLSDEEAAASAAVAVGHAVSGLPVHVSSGAGRTQLEPIGVGHGAGKRIGCKKETIPI